MKVGINLPSQFPFGSTTQMLEVYEQVGFDSYWSPDHILARQRVLQGSGLLQQVFRLRPQLLPQFTEVQPLAQSIEQFHVELVL